MFESLLTGVLIGFALAVPCSIIAMVVMMRERDKRFAQPVQPVIVNEWWHDWWNNTPHEVDARRWPVILGEAQGDGRRD